MSPVVFTHTQHLPARRVQPGHEDRRRVQWWNMPDAPRAPGEAQDGTVECRVSLLGKQQQLAQQQQQQAQAQQQHCLGRAARGRTHQFHSIPPGPHGR